MAAFAGRRALALRRPASCGRFRGLERADAAVARRVLACD
jgi:hypothetical protein